MTRSAGTDQRAEKIANKQIWIVSEGSPGHVSQSRGLAAALVAEFPAQIQQVEVRPKGSGGLRGIYQSLFRMVPGLRSVWVKLCSKSVSLPSGSPDILIASGGKSVFFARYLADKFSCPLVFCGSPAPYPITWFDCILSTETMDQCNHWIHTDVLLNPVTTENTKQAANEFTLENPSAASASAKFGAVLIGGQSRSQLFSTVDWESLGQQLNKLSEKNDWRWLISTSRRTGGEAEKVLESVIERKYILDAVWWSRVPRKTVRAYLGLAEAVFVGRDSMTMISEAVCSGKPVIVFGSQQSKPSQLIDSFVANLEAKSLITSCFCQDLAGAVAKGGRLVPLSQIPNQSYARKVLAMLALDSGLESKSYTVGIDL